MPVYACVTVTVSGLVCHALTAQPCYVQAAPILDARLASSYNYHSHLERQPFSSCVSQDSLDAGLSGVFAYYC